MLKGKLLQLQGRLERGNTNLFVLEISSGVGEGAALRRRDTC